MFLFSFSAFAGLFSDDDVVGYIPDKNDESKKIPLTFGNLKKAVKIDRPDLYNWCKNKGLLAVAILNDRDEFTMDDALDKLKSAEKTLPTYMYIELERIVRETYRYSSKGNYERKQDDRTREYINAEEFQTCILHGF